jgi:hypothetical protein
MRETVKTAAWLGAAALMAILAAWTQPERVTPAILSDQGELFYPNFRDPQAARVIEVIDYEESTATARPLKIEFRKGRWVVASHHNYPVELGGPPGAAGGRAGGPAQGHSSLGLSRGARPVRRD